MFALYRCSIFYCYYSNGILFGIFLYSKLFFGHMLWTNILWQSKWHYLRTTLRWSQRKIAMPYLLIYDQNIHDKTYSNVLCSVELYICVQVPLKFIALWSKCIKDYVQRNETKQESLFSMFEYIAGVCVWVWVCVKWQWISDAFEIQGRT